MITREELYIINNKIINNIGGYQTPYTRKNNCESIINSSEYAYSDNILHKIIYIFYRLLTSHIFNDGNKRTAWIVFKLLLDKHDFYYENDIKRDFDLILGIINKKYNIDEVIKIIGDVINGN